MRQIFITLSVVLSATSALANSEIPRSMQYKKNIKTLNSSESQYHISSKTVYPDKGNVTRRNSFSTIKGNEGGMIFAADERSERGLFASTRPYNVRKLDYVGKMKEVDYQRNDDAGLAVTSKLSEDKIDGFDVDMEYYADAGNSVSNVVNSEKSFGAGPLATYSFNDNTDMKMGYQAEMRGDNADQALKWQIGHKF